MRAPTDATSRCARIALAFVAACSSPSSADPADAGPGAPRADAAIDQPSDGGAGAGDAGASLCDTTRACKGSGRPGQACVVRVDATLVDPSGAPAVGVAVNVCGTDLCTRAITSDASGKVHGPVCLFMKSPSLKLFEDPAWAPFAARLPAGQQEVDLGKVTVVPLPAAGAPFPPKAQGGSVASSGVSLGVTADSFTFDIEHQEPASQQFRAVEIPAAKLPPGLTGTVATAWGMAPLNTTLTPGATLAVPNTMGWPSGAAVQFYLDGTDGRASGTIAPWGEWGPIGVGSVSADAKTVALTPSSGGLRAIGLVGLALK